VGTGGSIVHEMVKKSHIKMQKLKKGGQSVGGVGWGKKSVVESKERERVGKPNHDSRRRRRQTISRREWAQ